MQNNSPKDIEKQDDGILEVSAAIKKVKMRKAFIYAKRFALVVMTLGSLGILIIQGKICLSK